MGIEKSPSTLSSAIIAYLRSDGRTLREIADLLEVSESYVSRVARGERQLSVPHLEQLERLEGNSLPLILLEAERERTPRKHLRAIDDLMNLMRRSHELEKELRHGDEQDDAGIQIEDMVIAGEQVRLIKLPENEATKNGLTPRILREFSAAALQAPDSILVWTAAEGRVFCSGLDKNELLHALRKHDTPAPLLGALVTLYNVLAFHPSPTVCILRGAARGGGVGLACIADVVVASRAASLELPDDPAYRALAKILIPILEWRRFLSGVLKLNWFGKKFSATAAKHAGLVEKISSVADFETMLEAAFEILRGRSSSPKQKRQRATGTLRLPVSALKKMNESYYAALEPKPTALLRADLEEWAIAKAG